MRVLVIGFYGMGNTGDEAILNGLVVTMRRIDPDIGIDVGTELPFIYFGDYNEWRGVSSLMKDGIYYDVGSRSLTNYAFGEGTERIGLVILGGGGLSIGYGYGLVMRAMDAGIPVINMGIEYRNECRTFSLFHEFLKRFSDIAVRSRDSSNFLTSLGIHHHLTFCPSLQVDPVTCDPLPDDYIVITPRRTNDSDDEMQVQIIVDKLKELNKPAILIPFSKYDLAGFPIDMKICEEVKSQYQNSSIIPKLDGYKPGSYKFIISKASLLINSGRFHASIFAAEFGVPTIHSCPADSADKIYNFLSEFGIEKRHSWADGFGPPVDFGSLENKDIMNRFRGLEKMNSEILKTYIPSS